MNLDEKEKYGQNQPNFQDEKNQYKENDSDAAPLDNSVTNDEEQELNRSFSNQDRDDDLDDDNDNDLERDIDEDLDNEFDNDDDHRRQNNLSTDADV